MHLRGKELRSVPVQFLRIIKSQSERMRELVSELLDVARIETGTLSVTPEPAEVAALVDEARTTFQSGDGRNNIAIDVEPDLPFVMADRRRIAQCSATCCPTRRATPRNRRSLE